MARANVCLTYDFDAVSLPLWVFDAWDAPTAQSRGLFGADVGVPRILDLHDEHDIPATFFTPGHTIDSFPEAAGEIHDRGYDIQHHGWDHISPLNYDSVEEEREDMERAVDSIYDLTGEKPTGFRSGAWALSEHTLGLLDELGFRWDSSLMATEFTPYWAPDGWEAPEDGPYQRGEPTDIVEIPPNWQRDDFPPLEFVWGGNWGFAPADATFGRWRDQFDWMYENVDGGVYVLTMHPQVSGRSELIMRHEQLIEYMKRKPDVAFKTMDTVAEEFRNGDL